MTFVQSQEVIMPQNIWYTTELITNYCYEGLSHNVLGPSDVNLFKCLVLHLTLMLTFIVHDGDLLTGAQGIIG